MSKPKSGLASQADAGATTPEARLDSKLKAMFAAMKRDAARSVLPDLSALPKGRDVRN